jgi:DNA replication protein DnaC
MSAATLELRLKGFHLPSFVSHYAGLAEQAARGGWSHVRYLDELAAVEAAERAERRIARLLTASKLPRDKTFGTLDMERFAKSVRTQVARLAEGHFLEGATNLCVFGHPGTGKTHVVSALGHALVRLGHSVLFTSVSSLVERLLEAKRDLRLTRELRRLDRVECLVLDDIGYVQHDRAEMEVLFALLAERYERKSVMITSNLVFSQWDQIFKDPMTTAAAIDRVVHHSVILELDVPSYRAEAAQKRTRAKRTNGGQKEKQARSGE